MVTVYGIIKEALDLPVSFNLVDSFVHANELPANSFEDFTPPRYERDVIRFIPKKIDMSISYSKNMYVMPHAIVEYDSDEKSFIWDRKIMFYNLAAPKEPSKT